MTDRELKEAQLLARQLEAEWVSLQGQRALEGKMALTRGHQIFGPVQAYIL